MHPQEMAFSLPIKARIYRSLIEYWCSGVSQEVESNYKRDEKDLQSFTNPCTYNNTFQIPQKHQYEETADTVTRRCSLQYLT